MNEMNLGTHRRVGATQLYMSGALLGTSAESAFYLARISLVKFQNP